jgi:hypothetical protein
VVQTAAVVAVLLVHGLSLANYYFDPRYSREDARSAVRFLLESAQPTHPILVVGNELPLQYYSSGRLPLVSWGRTVIDDQSALLAHLDQLRLQPELWLVTIRPWEDDPQGLLKAALDARHRLIERQSFPGIEIYAYRLD